MATAKTTLQLKAELYKMSIERYTQEAQNAGNAYEREMYWGMAEACEQKIYNIKQYGQCENPELIYDEQGIWVGYRLKNGTEVWNSGMPTV